MAGKRQPTDVVMANGKKHLSRAEEARRREGELRLPTAKTAKPPRWMPEGLKKEFRALGRQLIQAGLYTDLDADTLGQYLLSRLDWLNAEKRANAAIVQGEGEDAQTWSAVQNRYFKQARQCAEAMGLSVTSRCRIVLPAGLQNPAEDDNPFLQLIEGGM